MLLLLPLREDCTEQVVDQLGAHIVLNLDYTLPTGA